LSKPTKNPTPPTKSRRKNPRGGAYWTLFAVCAALSFAGGFWYTYQATSQVSVKDPGAIDVPMATPLPNQALVTPGPDVAVEEPAEPETTVAASDLGQAATPAPAATPKANAAPATQEQTVAKAVDAAASGVYRVQVGSYSSREEAQAMVEELAVAGIDAMVVEDEGKYHAQIGAYGSRERALAVADDVNTKGYSVTIRH